VVDLLKSEPAAMTAPQKLTSTPLTLSRSQGAQPALDARWAETRNRAERILEGKSEYVYDQSFDAPGAEVTILAPMPGHAYLARAAGWLPAPQCIGLTRVHGAAPVLDAEQEAHLFRRMNYLKCRASRLRESLDPAHVGESDLDLVQRLEAEALVVKNQIIRHYLRLVVSIAKQRSGPKCNLFELVSDGNLGLIRAVEKFDFARGFRFSTYATKAISRRLARSIPRQRREHHRFVTGFEKLLKAAVDYRIDESLRETDSRLDWKSVKGLLDRLDDRERHILISRFGLDGAKALTLAQLGTELGITRQRVLQIESKARDKLRTLVRDEFCVAADTRSTIQMETR
jgi:RNA polymerase primary sigma factor